MIVLLAIIALLVQHQQRRSHVQSELSGRSRRGKTRAAVASALLGFLAQRQAWPLQLLALQAIIARWVPFIQNLVQSGLTEQARA